jgi:hypothetical protein
MLQLQHLRTCTTRTLRRTISSSIARSTSTMQKPTAKTKATSSSSQPAGKLVLTPQSFFSTASASSSSTAKIASQDASSLPVFTDAAGQPILLFEPGEDSKQTGRQLVEASLHGERHFFVGKIDTEKRLHGPGLHFGSDGRLKSRGNWVHGVLEGEGEAHFADGASYFGSFVAGQPSGVGCFLYANGAVFEGQCLKGERHGLGVRWGVEAGDYFAGEWKAGDPVRDCPVPCNLLPKGVRLSPAARQATILMMTDGQYYIGETNAAHEPEGLGILFAADGTLLAKGSWKEFRCFAAKK